jgi:hypothetical protein
MSVKLDWEIEADRASERAGVDPLRQQERRRERIILMVLTLLILGGVFSIGALLFWRIRSVDQALEQGLTSAARAEVLALKIGDLPGFLGLMRGGSADWTPAQSARFGRYQVLKEGGKIQFTDNILTTEVDGQRGRVTVEEILDGQRQMAVWYYWRYPDGWRHVPSDLTFWGEADTIKGKQTTIEFKAMDRPYAEALATRIERWWTQQCPVLGCTNVPPLTLRIVADTDQRPTWDTENTADGLVLKIGSPLAVGDRAPLDLPPLWEQAIAAKLAERLFDHATGNLQTNPNTDAAWLRDSVIDWLTAAMLGRGDLTQIAFIDSIQKKYGVASVASIVQTLSVNSDISIVGRALKQPLEALDLDWRTFFQWRLALEKEFVKVGNQKELLELWDSTPEALSALRVRFTQTTLPLPQVETVQLNGTTATIGAKTNGQPAQMQFRVVNGTWKRFA